jgi:Fe-S cluster assembly ATP-binding protein
MLEINNLHCEIEGKSILNGINLKVDKGEIHALMGPNGSGKSTLANVISGHEDYEITKGNIYFKSNEINELSASERAHEGIFMSFQYPVEIPGLTVTNFIKTAINESRKAKGLDEMSSREMLKKIREKSSLLDIDSKLLSRSLNEGFSGGEKKRNEIFQMAMLEPELAVLDETDSGLDIDMLKIVANGVIKFSNDYIVPDFVHVILDGKVVKSGDQSLAKRIEDKGYDWLKKEIK